MVDYNIKLRNCVSFDIIYTFKLMLELKKSKVCKHTCNKILHYTSKHTRLVDERHKRKTVIVVDCFVALFCHLSLNCF